MATILCIETATTNCSVALSVNGSVIALEEDNSKQYSHAERLHTFVETVLSKSNVEKSSLEAIAVSKGPGSYTGLRIGVSAAKGLCYALDIPLISVPTLQSLAHQVKESKGYIVPMLDARRMEVYSAIYSSDGDVQRETMAEVLTTESFSEYLTDSKVSFIGSGVEKFQNIIEHNNAVFLKDKSPSAREMASISSMKFDQNEFEDVAYFEPFYLKDFISNSRP